MNYFYHYYEKRSGPFMNLSDLSLDEAKLVLNRIRRDKTVMASQRYDGYLERRRELELIARTIFCEKGGTPQRSTPHYMVIGACDWLQTWYQEGECLAIHHSAFSPDTVSFSYGDLFPTFSPRITDRKEYRSQVYTWQEILELIEKYGLPQEWNPDGRYGPERYIEVQVWDDAPLAQYRKEHRKISE